MYASPTSLIEAVCSGACYDSHHCFIGSGMDKFAHIPPAMLSSTSINSIKSLIPHKFGLFKTCNSGNVERLFRDKPLRIIKAKQAVAHEGDKFSGVFFLLKGSIKTTRKSGRGYETILWFGQPGDIIGLHSFANRKNYIYTSVAMEDSAVCFIPTPELDKFIEKENAFSLAMIRILSSRITQVEERLTSIAQKPTGKRVAETLLSLCPVESLHEDRYGKVTSETKIFDVSDFASFIGTTKSYLTKLLLRLSAQGIIEMNKGKMTIKDVNKLIMLSNGGLRN